MTGYQFCEGDTVDFLVANAFFNNLALNVLPLYEGKVFDPAMSHDFDTALAGTEAHVPEAEAKVRARGAPGWTSASRMTRSAWCS